MSFFPAGMLSGVLFQRRANDTIAPHFVNRYVVTDVLLATRQGARRPILPSIATLSSPTVSLFRMLYEVMRSLVLCLLTWIPLTWSLGLGKGTRRLSKISVANTNIFYHDGKALAACESGPPMRIMLPKLETGGWWTGDEGKSWASGIGPLKLFNEMTTAHPHTDTSTNELLLYHSTFVAPYLRISVIPPRSSRRSALIGATVPGMKEGKLMHDFAATKTRTVVMDLPLTLDPRNLLSGKPVVHYEPTAAVRFGVFPRREPEKVRWYEDPTACCIYHTANCWDESQGDSLTSGSSEDAVNFLACRLNSATLIYSAGNTLPPATAKAPTGEEERCELYYWRFVDPPKAAELVPALDSTTLEKDPKVQHDSPARITHSFPLSRVPFEFPTINLAHAPAAGLGPNRFVYGCSMREGTFDAGMGRHSAKIDCLVKMDVHSLVRKGRAMVDAGKLKKGEAVDMRSMPEIIASAEETQDDSLTSDITVFQLPRGWYAQETTFVPRSDPQGEDDGFLLFFCFDELTQLHPATGEPLPSAVSQLWVLDARDMKTLVARIELPARVPYGLHGKWFTETEIDGQERVDEQSVRTWALRGVQKSDRKREEERCKAASKANVLTTLRRWAELWA